MTDKLHVFLSYKKHGGVTPEYALRIFERLQNADPPLEVFIDVKRIETADEWEKVIYAKIHASDVLILLLEPETANSEWVQREVDFARGAGVEVLPLRVADEGVDLTAAVQKLAMNSIQYSKYFRETEADYQELIGNIKRLALVTRDTQRNLFRSRENHWYSLPVQFQFKQQTFRLRNGLHPDFRLHLTVGNVLMLQPDTIDVIVNSENDYLQMARFFEIHTLSARLRVAGAHRVKGELIEDTIQYDLDQIPVRRPVPLQQVIVTRAGHPNGELRKKKGIKFIFHAITVQYMIGGERPVKALDGELPTFETIKNCLEAVDETNQNIALKQAAGVPDNFLITSMALPLFGTGIGGSTIKSVAPAMAKGLALALEEVGPFTLQNLHLLVYSAHEVEPVRAALAERFESVS
jgi:O-acetyl-ADP-ribose deacetylase (regulator of RNase III)